MFYFRTILLSIISLLNEPNTFSPANVDASVMYRKWKDSRGKDKEYETIIRYNFVTSGLFNPFPHFDAFAAPASKQCGKKRNSDYEQFLLLPQCFQMLSVSKYNCNLEGLMNLISLEHENFSLSDVLV